MPVAFVPPASIECRQSSITARKINPGQPIRNEHAALMGRFLYRFKLDFNSEAYVMQELDPKMAIIDSRSMLNEGDGIKGDMISGLSSSLMKRDNATLVSASGRHRASFLRLSGFVYAKLEKSFRGIENKIRLLN